MQEGVDIPECDAVVFADDIESSIDCCQFIGRCQRICKNKNISYVIIPLYKCSKEELINERKAYNTCRLILRALAEEDSFIGQYFKDIDLKGNERKGNMIQWFKKEEDKEYKMERKIIEDINQLSPETFEKAKEYVKTLKLKSKEEYEKWCDHRQDHFNIPRKAEKVYLKMGWLSWSDYLGTDKLSKEEVRKLIFKENRKREEKITTEKDFN